mmetsp:Transcript_19412/g.55849  ORF Transcript_19412/g.55849 Transcript_19412/m.55849 type:complete len:237 (-) Transcript_19412:404-1114(-)
MKISLVYFLSVVAGVPSSVLGANDSSTYRTLRRVKDLDDEDEKLLVEEIFDGDAEQRKLAAPCDEICRAKRRLVRCKKKAREEAREGRNAWTKEDQEKVGGGRRLKLYCEYKYLWQERKRYCPDYCLEASSKKSGATLEIKDCSRSPLQKFEEIGGVLRPAWNKKLCVKSDKLRRCDDSLAGFRGNHFEIKLSNQKKRRQEKCFSNPHHPKNCEPVRFSECKEARNSHTNYWTWDH